MITEAGARSLALGSFDACPVLHAEPQPQRQHLQRPGHRPAPHDPYRGGGLGVGNPAWPPAMRRHMKTCRHARADRARRTPGGALPGGGGGNFLGGGGGPKFRGFFGEKQEDHWALVTRIQGEGSPRRDPCKTWPSNSSNRFATDSMVRPGPVGLERRPPTRLGAEGHSTPMFDFLLFRALVLPAARHPPRPCHADLHAIAGCGLAWPTGRQAARCQSDLPAHPDLYGIPAKLGGPWMPRNCRGWRLTCNAPDPIRQLTLLVDDDRARVPWTMLRSSAGARPVTGP